MKCETMLAMGVKFFFLVILCTTLLYGQQYTFRSVDIPGGDYTDTECNNNVGQILGNYTSAGLTSPKEAFLLYQGTFRPVAGYPGAASTYFVGVNPSGGKIVGTWTDTSGTQHGFLLAKGKYTSLDYPSATWTAAIDINDAGTIVGDYEESGAEHGFKFQGGKYTNIDPPGVAGSAAATINNLGQVVGAYSTTDGLLDSGVQGYWLVGSSYTTINYPGAAQTFAVGLNSSSQIVGWYIDGSGVTHAFTDNGGTFSNIDYPGATTSYGIEINDYGQILGQWYSSSVDVQHGYIANEIPGSSSAHGETGPRGKVPSRR